MRKKLALTIGAILVFTVLFTAIVQYQFGVPLTFLSAGSLFINAVSVTPRPDLDRTIEKKISIPIFENGKKIGESNAYIEMDTGKHLVSFGSYNETYETPQPQEVIIKHRQKTTVKVVYLAHFAYLAVNTEKYDEYTETQTPFAADIFLDEKWVGTGHVSILFQKNELGNYTVSFSANSSEIEGYSKPSNLTVLIKRTKTTLITGKFKKILTDEQREYVLIRSRARHPGGGTKYLDPDSNVVCDNFLKWVLDNKIGVPFYYMVVWVRNAHWRYGAHPGFITYYIAQYGGILEDERVDSLRKFYLSMLRLGVNVTESSQEQKLYRMSYKNHPETMFLLELSFKNIDAQAIERVEGGKISGFDQNELENVTLLFPYVLPAGLELLFEQASRVYVQQGTRLEHLTTVHPYFKEFTNHEGWEKAWYYDAWKKLSIQSLIEFYLSDAISKIRGILEATIMGSVLLSPIQFLALVRWLV